MNDDLIKLADQYEGNLLNYFVGMSPKQSKKFNFKTLLTWSDKTFLTLFQRFSPCFRL